MSSPAIGNWALMAATWRRYSVLVLVGLIATPMTLRADDWPQWRGPDRLAVWHETGIVQQLPDEFKVSWRIPIRSGYSGPAVAGGRMYLRTRTHLIAVGGEKVAAR